MPFQVIFSTYQQPQGIITFFTAGEDQIITCATNVTLEATVLGDITGHTFLWEQLTGDPVNWLTPQDQFVVQFEQINTDDKSFRFWIDKGTPFEQFDDVWTYNTPISENDVSVTTSYPTTYFGTGGDRRLVRNERIWLRPTTNPNTGNNVPTAGLLEFTVPSDSEYITRVGVEQYVLGSGWTEIDSIPKEDVEGLVHYIYPTLLSLDQSYRIVLYFDDKRYNYSTTHNSDSLSLVNPTTPVGFTQTNVAGISAETPAQITNYDVIVRTLIQETQIDTNSGLTGVSATNSSIVSNYNVIERTLIQEAAIDANAGVTGVTSTNSVLIDNYNVLDLTGGEIGG